MASQNYDIKSKEIKSGRKFISDLVFRGGSLVHLGRLFKDLPQATECSRGSKYLNISVLPSFQCLWDICNVCYLYFCELQLFTTHFFKKGILFYYHSKGRLQRGATTAAFQTSHLCRRIWTYSVSFSSCTKLPTDVSVVILHISRLGVIKWAWLCVRKVRAFCSIVFLYAHGPRVGLL